VGVLLRALAATDAQVSTTNDLAIDAGRDLVCSTRHPMRTTMQLLLHLLCSTPVDTDSVIQTLLMKVVQCAKRV
jgi:hypothetical protein